MTFVGHGIGNRHEAAIDGATVTAQDVTAKASDNALIVGVAVGMAATGGQFAGMGSATANVNYSTATARIGAATYGADLGTTVTTMGAKAADAVTVDAASSSQKARAHQERAFCS